MTFAESLAGATQQGACALIDASANFFALIKRVPIPVGSAAAENYWRALGRKVCNKEDPGGPPPVEGGQCPGVRYKVEGAVKYKFNPACETTSPSFVGFVYGPISGLFSRLRIISPGSEVFDAVAVAYETADAPNPTEIVLGSFSRNNLECDPTSELVDVTISPPPGEVDDCPGYIPPPPPPPGWNQVIINNFTWINNAGDVVNEGDLNLEFGLAYINADLDLEMPVKIDVGGISFNGTFNFDRGAFEFDFSRDVVNNFGPPSPRPPDGADPNPGPPLPNNPDKPGDIEPDPDVDEGDDSGDGDDEGVDRIVAARVVVNSVNSESIGTFIQNRNPDIAIPNYGYIQFFIETEGGFGGWTADIPVKNANHFIPCPWPDGATNVRGTPRRGVLWGIQALRSSIPTKRIFP